MNKVGSEMRDILEQLTKTGVPVPAQLRDKLDKYHQIDVIDVDIETQRGYFDYVFEDMDTFRRGKALGRQHLSDATVARHSDHVASQGDPPTKRVVDYSRLGQMSAEG